MSAVAHNTQLRSAQRSYDAAAPDYDESRDRIADEIRDDAGLMLQIADQCSQDWTEHAELFQAVADLPLYGLNWRAPRFVMSAAQINAIRGVLRMAERMNDLRDREISRRVDARVAA